MIISNYSATYEDVVYNILYRKTDVGAVKKTVLVRLAAEDPKVAKGAFHHIANPSRCRKQSCRPARPQRIAQRVDQDRVAEHARRSGGASKRYGS